MASTGSPSKLVLVKHAMPEIRPELPAKLWELSAEGRQAAWRLARDLAAYEPAWVLSSLEPKARETGKIVAEALALPFESLPNLHEHARENEPFTSQTAFEASVKRFFEHSERLVHGLETARQAQERFSAAVEGALAARQGATVVVAHGTVISLFAAQKTGAEPCALWRSLGLPSYLVFSLPDYRLLEQVLRV